MRATAVIVLAVASIVTVLVALWWTIDGVLAKWRRGALRVPSPRDLMHRESLVERPRK